MFRKRFRISNKTIHWAAKIRLPLREFSMVVIPRFGAAKCLASAMTGKKTQSTRITNSSTKLTRHPPSDWTGRPGSTTISGRWLLYALFGTLAVAAICGWGVLCLLFWQGSWQLLYHPSVAVTQTPANAGMLFDPVAFAVTDDGTARLKGWWISVPAEAPFIRYTVIFLHGQNGNLGDTVEALVPLHSIGLNVFAFDYRGYGQSQFVRPSEARWRQDAEWALRYLTETRHVPANTIVLDGEDL